MSAAPAKAEYRGSVEQRKYERTRTALTGKMFVPAEERTIECGVVDISAGGAGVTCAEMPPLETYVVLYVDDYGRFESVVTRVVGDVLGLRFVCNDAKRARLVEKLTNPVRPVAGRRCFPSPLEAPQGIADLVVHARHRRARDVRGDRYLPVRRVIENRDSTVNRRDDSDRSHGGARHPPP
ncbi:MAG: PilZ domain-containing protein [Rhizomicrobium sp.]